MDADSKEAIEPAGAAPSALDNILELIRKKQKLSVLDKTKKDWGEYKEENRSVEEELDAYRSCRELITESLSARGMPGCR